MEGFKHFRDTALRRIFLGDFELVIKCRQCPRNFVNQWLAGGPVTHFLPDAAAVGFFAKEFFVPSGPISWANVTTIQIFPAGTHKNW